MRVLLSKLTGKARTTVPKEVRRVLGVKPGDTIVYRIANGKVTLGRARPLDRAYLKAVESTVSEWASAEDAAAYDKL